jgi:hypothetical protein
MNTLYCARGQAENLIKLHKGQLASDRTSCRSAFANQVRLVLHTAAYWLMLAVRDAIPKPQTLATAEFTTLRMRLLKIAARDHRDRNTGPYRVGRRPPGSRVVPWYRAQPPTRRPMTQGAAAPCLIQNYKLQRPAPPNPNRDETGAMPNRVQRSDHRLNRAR